MLQHHHDTPGFSFAVRIDEVNLDEEEGGCYWEVDFAA